MFGIKDYNPTFYEDKNKLIKDHGNKLRSLIGLTIDEVWTVHYAPDGLFWADGPVMIRLGAKQLEFCSYKDNGIAVTWDEIDLEENLDWYGSRELNLEWRKNELDNISHVIGQTIRNIEVMEEVVKPIDNHPNLLCGLGFEIEKGYLALFNAFDETAISYSRDEKYVYTGV